MRIALKVVSAGLEVDWHVVGLAGQLKKIAYWWEVQFAGVRIRQEMDVVYAD